MSVKPPAESRYALVTGAARGLGREFCLRLARDGYQLALADVDAAAADETRRLVEQAGGAARVEACDVTQFDQWLALRDRLRTAWPRLDLVVNNAGMYAAGYVGSLDLAEAERLIRLNLLGVLYGCHAMVPWLADSAAARPKAHRRELTAHLINVASSFAFLCPPGMAPYNLSKAGVVALSETLFTELRPRSIGVTVVCPGPMPTRFVEAASFETEDLRRLTESHVARSTLDPAAVAEAALAASRRGELYVVMGRDQRWYWRAKRWMPLGLLRRVARRVRRDLAHFRSQRPTTND